MVEVKYVETYICNSCICLLTFIYMKCKSEKRSNEPYTETRNDSFFIP